jgi:hypothetical protein
MEQRTGWTDERFDVTLAHVLRVGVLAVLGEWRTVDAEGQAAGPPTPYVGEMTQNMIHEGECILGC